VKPVQMCNEIINGLFCYVQSIRVVCRDVRKPSLLKTTLW